MHIGKMFEGSDRGAQTGGKGKEGERGKERRTAFCRELVDQQRGDTLTAAYKVMNSDQGSASHALDADGGDASGSKGRIKRSGGATGEGAGRE